MFGCAAAGAVAELILVRSYTCDTESPASDMSGRCSGEPAFVDARFVVGAQPPFFYTPKFAGLTALRWTMVAIAAIPVILYFLGLLPPAFLGLASNVVFSVIFFGVAGLCCYSLWPRHTQKT